jgi:hypothetical protein
MSASKVVAFPVDVAAGHTAETGTSVKPPGDGIINVIRRKQGDYWVANPGTNPKQTRKPRSHMICVYNSSSLSAKHRRVKTKSLFVYHFSPDFICTDTENSSTNN